jgi:hypothetical protein
MQLTLRQSPVVSATLHHTDMVVAVHRVLESVGELGTVDSRAVVDVTYERSMFCFLLRLDTCLGIQLY